MRLFDAAQRCLERFEHGRAVELGRRALAALEDDDPHPADLIQVLLVIAQAQTQLGHPRRARASLRRALALLRRVGNEFVQLHIETHVLWGQALRDEGELVSAERAFVKAAGLGRDLPLALASVRNNLGVLFKAAGRFPEARRQYRLALAAAERRPRESLALQATLHHNLGGLHHSEGRHARGEPHARRSVALRKRLRGPAHPEVAMDLCALGGLLDGQRKFDESEKLYRRALRVFERAFGPDHLEIATTLNNLAALTVERGDFDEAEAMYLRALRVKRRHHPASHPEVALTMHNLARLHARAGRPREATKLERRAYGIMRRRLGPGHPWTRACLAALQTDERRA